MYGCLFHEREYLSRPHNFLHRIELFDNNLYFRWYQMIHILYDSWHILKVAPQNGGYPYELKDVEFLKAHGFVRDEGSGQALEKGKRV